MPRVGSTRYLAIDAGPIYDDRGELLAVVETVRDMTAKKQAQIALEALASSDGLTGLANRRMFDKHLRQECRRAQREASPISLMMIDIDYFKNYNDALGHQRGDECLRMVGAVIADQMLRPGDLAARYGGEEFAVILPNTPLAGGISVADRILISINAAALSHPTSPVANRVTVSIGVASGKYLHNEFDLIAAADAALYQAKRNGRHQVAADMIRQDTEVGAKAPKRKGRRIQVSELRRPTATPPQ
jgi:diguanylate cyclase (GGDEF)-like protein